MIIGNNNKENQFANQNFTNKMNVIKENANNFQNIWQHETINPMKNSNVLDKNEMQEKSFQMLQDRLNKGLISLEEFNKKCRELGKK